MKTVRDVLAQKGNEVSSVRADDTVFSALELMAAKEIGSLLVLDGDGPVGMFTERDYARQVILKGKASRDTAVGDVMTRRVMYVRPEQSVDDCMALMTDKRVRHLPVLEDGRVVGIISIGDAVKAMISEKEFIIEQLANYIQNG